VTDGACNNTQTDPNNCGSCGHTCSASFFTCTTGHCGNEVAEVVGGSYHSCVVLYGGAVYCWGDNALGELGDGSLAGTAACTSSGTNHPCRPAPAVVSTVANVVQVSIGLEQSCAVEKDGSVWCWGLNTSGELGHSSTGDMTCTDVDAATTVPCNPTPAKVALPGGVEIMSVAAGRRYTCALSTTGDVYCWGDNSWGELGVALSTASTSTPQKVGVSSTAFPAAVTQITTDDNDYPLVCALSSGEVWCWGGSAVGGTGHDPTSDPACGATTCNFTPQVVKTTQGAAFGGVASVGVGRDFGCARKTDGTVWCWGGTSWGSLGQGPSQTGGPSPVQDTLALPSNVAALYVGGGNVVFATDQTGALWAWGRNDYGLLGNGTVTGAEPTPKATGFTGATQISAGEGSALALKADGSVWVWGDNTFAELGHASGAEGDQPAAGGECNPQPAELLGLP
jgi:alpha-tubulin suppressor-like RCC1 family protein